MSWNHYSILVICINLLQWNFVLIFALWEILLNSFTLAQLRKGFFSFVRFHHNFINFIIYAKMACIGSDFYVFFISHFWHQWKSLWWAVVMDVQRHYNTVSGLWQLSVSAFLSPHSNENKDSQILGCFWD